MKKLLLILFAILTTHMYSQDTKKEVTGTVTDETGNTLIGVTVLSGENGTYTDFDGKYKIIVDNTSSKITFSSIGLETIEIIVGDQKEINVILKENILKMDDVVVIGYGTQKRENVTGSVAKVKSENIENAPVSRLDQALQGKIAGVRIQNVSSEAGADTKISVRGISSINAGSSPLVVVDGQPLPDGFASINNADVESVEVLKDAASAAIYGSRGASGVILITTKSGKSNKTKFTFRNSTGFKTAYETHDILSTSEYVELLYKERDLKALDPTVPANQLGIPANQLAQYAIEQNFFGGNGTDYQSKALRTAVYRDTQFNVSGGIKGLRYYVSTGYQEDEGMMLKSNFQKINFRTKVDIDLTSKLKLSINLNPSHTKTETPEPNYTDYYRFPSFLPVYHTAETAAFVNQNPQYAGIKEGDYAEVIHFYGLQYDGIGPDGEPFSSNSNPFTSNNVNPVRRLNETNEDRNDFRFQGGATLTYEITPSLSIKTSNSIYNRNTDRLNWDSANAVRFSSPNKGEFINGKYFDFLTENTINFKKEFNNHSFDAVAGATYQSTQTAATQVTGLNFPTDDIRTLTNAGSIDQAGTFGSKEKVALQSVLSRVNYSYKDKYLVSLSYRADGSSLFAPGKKWGGFPAASVGWIVSKENFMANVNVINRLGFRASYGVSGNNRITPFSYQNILSNNGYVFGSGNGNLVLGQGSLVDVTGNKDITWEKTFQTNLGLDLTMLNNRVDLTLDVFNSKTDQLLLEQPTQSFTGTNRFFNNTGSLINKGVEIELGTKNINSENFKWKTSLNFSRIRNEIDNLGNVDLIQSLGERGEVYQNKVGNPLVQFFGYQTDGVWLSQQQVDDSGLTSSNNAVFLRPGGLKIVDVNGDGVIDINDRTVIGNPYPDFTWGITNTFNYKNFELSFTVQGSKGGSLINGDLNYNEMKQRNTKVIANRWISAANPGDGQTPFETLGVNWMLTDYVVEDATYASLREVNLSYNFNTDVISKIGLSGLRFFVSGQNLYYIMANGYRGINPEARSQTGLYNTSLIDGYQRGGFPIPRTIIFGLEVNF